MPFSDFFLVLFIRKKPFLKFQLVSNGRDTKNYVQQKMKNNISINCIKRNILCAISTLTYSRRTFAGTFFLLLLSPFIIIIIVVVCALFFVAVTILVRPIYKYRLPQVNFLWLFIVFIYIYFHCSFCSYVIYLQMFFVLS